MNNFSVYHQVHSNKPETISVIEQFRKIYPDNCYYLISDNGENHEEIAKKYSCNYIHSNFHTGLWQSSHPDVINKNHCYGWNKEESIEFLKRWYKICNLSTDKYIFIIEDDIFVTKPIKITNQNFNFTHVPVLANPFNNKIKQYIKNFYPQNTLNLYGTCAGNFINRILLIECYEKIISFFEKEYDNLKNIENNLGFCDSNFDFIFGCLSIEGTPNLEYSEESKDFPIYHSREKQWYRWNTLYNKIRYNKTKIVEKT